MDIPAISLSDLLKALRDDRYDTILIGDTNFNQFESVTMSPNKNVLIKSESRGTVFGKLIIDGPVTLDGVIVDHLTVTAGSTVTLIDCDVQDLVVIGNCGLNKTSLINVDISGTAHIIDSNISGFLCVRGSGRLTGIRCSAVAQSIITCTGSVVKFINCQLKRESNTESLLGAIASVLPKWLVPRVELAPAQYVGCLMNFRVK